MAKLVLASTSPWRRSMLEAAGFRVLAESPGIDEGEIVGREPDETARLRARAKARFVATLHPDSTVVGADQVIYLDGELLGKPANSEKHLGQLQKLRGRAHSLTTAVAIVFGGEIDEFSVTTMVRFRSDLSDDELRAYVACGEARGCAGGYMIEKRGAWLVESVEGDWSNIIGLPVLHLIGRLRARGWSIPRGGDAHE